MSKFATCLNCMDGRAQLPLINWIKERYSVDYVDMITEAGMDGYLANCDLLPSELKRKINISIEKHGSGQIFIVGHHDCGGHPVDKDTHNEHIIIAVDKIKLFKPDCSVIGIWLNDSWEIEIIVEK